MPPPAAITARHGHGDTRADGALRESASVAGGVRPVCLPGCSTRPSATPSRLPSQSPLCSQVTAPEARADTGTCLSKQVTSSQAVTPPHWHGSVTGGTTGTWGGGWGYWGIVPGSAWSRIGKAICSTAHRSSSECRWLRTLSSAVSSACTRPHRLTPSHAVSGSVQCHAAQPTALSLVQTRTCVCVESNISRSVFPPKAKTPLGILWWHVSNNTAVGGCVSG